jgi:hypothetical protein
LRSTKSSFRRDVSFNEILFGLKRYGIGSLFE